MKSNLAKLQLFESSCVSLYQICKPGFGWFLTFLLADPVKLNQIGWGESVNCCLHVSPQMFYGVKSGLFLGHSRT